MLKLSLLVLLLVVAVNCRRLSKLERLENVLSETDVMLKELKREGILSWKLYFPPPFQKVATMQYMIEINRMNIGLKYICFLLQGLPCEFTPLEHYSHTISQKTIRRIGYKSK